MLFKRFFHVSEAYRVTALVVSYPVLALLIKLNSPAPIFSNRSGSERNASGSSFLIPHPCP